MKFFIYTLLFFAVFNVSASAQTVGINKGEIFYANNSSKISLQYQKKLDSLADYILFNPLEKIVLSCRPTSSKVAQQRGWDRTNGIIEYLSEKRNIPRDRFIFQTRSTGADNSVSFRLAEEGEDGPSSVPPPFPSLRRD